MKTPHRIARFLASATAIAVAAAALPALAVSDSWTGTTDGNWATSGNWLGGNVPGSGDTATFNAASANTTVSLGAGVTVSNLLFDTAGVSPYVIGSGAAGSQTLTLNLGGGISLSPTAAANQVLNANLSLPGIGFYNLFNNSAANTLTLAGTNAAATTGSAVIRVGGAGTTIISGPVLGGAGLIGLEKTNAGALYLTGGGTFAGTNVNSYLPGTSFGPVVLRAGPTVLAGGNYTNTGEFVLGGVIANGGAGNNASLTLIGSLLNVSSWFSLGRGNGVGTVSSDVILSNGASLLVGNFSGGFNGGNAANLPKGSLTLNDSSTLTVTGNGAVNLAESPGANMTLTLNGTSKFIAPGTGVKSLGMQGSGAVNLNDSSSMSLGNALCYVGYRVGTGVVNVASSAGFTNIGELRVGGSDASGTAYNAFGTFNSAGTVVIGSTTANQPLTIGRGNNSQNNCSGVVNVNGGTFTSMGDIILGYAGAGHAKLAVNGGTFNAATTVLRWFMIPEYDTATGELDVTNGVLNVNAGTPMRFSSGNNSAGINVVNLEGGAINFYSDFATTPGGGVVDLCAGSTGFAGTNIFNLDGGTLSVPQIVSTRANGTKVFNFNGGTLRAVAPLAPFIGTNTAFTVNVRNGGAVIDTGTNNVTVAGQLQHSTISGDAATDGGLTKLGAGALTLGGGGTYTGPTKVLGGRLILNTTAGVPGIGGDLVVSNGAALTLDATIGTAWPAANVSLGSNSVLTVAVSPYANGINGTGNLSLGNNVTNNFNYGTVSGVPTAAAINVAGSVAQGANVVINLSGTGLQPGWIFPVISSGAGGLTTNGFALGSLPPGIKAVLTNSTPNTLDVLVTSAGQLLTWYGTQDGVTPDFDWDINVSTNWYSLPNYTLAKYQQYLGNTIGDNVTFGDSALFTDGTNHVNVTTTVVPATVTFSSATPYVVSGPGGIGGATALVLTNETAAVYLQNNNSYTGGTVVGGGTLVITNDAALGAPAGGVALSGGALQLNGDVASARAILLAASSSIGVGLGANAALNGVVSGGGGLTKTDVGTLTLAGANTYTGATLVNAGTVALTGAVGPGAVTVGGVSGNAVLNLAGNVTAPNLFVGNAVDAVGAVYQTGGTVTLAGGTGDFLNVGNTDNSFGYYNAAGGVINVNGIAIGGENNPNVWPPAGNFAYGLLEVNGATINNIGWLVLSRGGANNIGVLNMFSGSLTFGGGGLGCNWELSGSDQTSIINILGGSVTSTNQGVNFRTANTGIINLNGGVLQATSVTGFGTLNFNGGTLRPAVGFTAPFLNLSSNVYVFSGGATIDDNGQALALNQPFLAPTNNGVAGVSITSPGAGYIAPPVVTITGDGSGATAIAQIDRTAGTVTNLILISPGVNYTYATVNFTGGGASSPASANVDSFAPSASGGLTKLGAGTLTFNAVNTYTGATVVAQGSLILSPIQQNTNSPVIVSNAATLAVSATGNQVTRVGDLTVGALATDSATLSFLLPTGTNPVAPLLEVGNLTLNGTNDIRVSGLLTAGTYPVLKYRGAFTGGGFLNPNVLTPHGYSGVASNDVATSTIYVTLSGAGGIVWQGYNPAPALTNLWDINSTTNWLSGLTPSTYTEGDKAIFDDTGSGLVLLSNNVSPGGLVITNNAVNYTLQGSGQIGGVAGLVKAGAGSATLNFANNSFSGATTISGGTLNLAGGGALGNASAVTLANAAGVNLTVSGNETIGSLAGGGANGGNVSTTNSLILGGNTSTTYSGAVTGPGSLQVQGVGTMTISNTVNVGAQVWVGGGSSASVQTLNIPAGATVAAGDWLVVGRDGSQGTINVTGGALLHSGTGNITLGTLGANPSGTINLYSGSISNATGETYLGEGSSLPDFGFYNQSGGTASLGNFYVGRGTSGGQGIGVANVTGGVLNAGNIEVAYGNNNTRYGTNLLTIGAGAVVNSSGYVRVGFAGSANMVGMLTNNGGILNVGATALYLGYWDPEGGNVTLNAGQINLQNNASIILGVQGNNSGTSTFTQNGGAVTFYSDAGTNVGGTGSLNIGNAGSGSYTYTLNGGTLTVPQVTHAGGPGSSTFTFNGGTLAAAGSSATFMQGLTTAYVMVGGAVIDTSSNSVTIAQALTDGDGQGGGLTKNGGGALTLDGVNTYTGPTLVSAGTLGGVGQIAGALTNNAILAPGDGGIGALTVNGDITLAAGSTNVFAVDGTAATSAQIVAGGAVNYGGALRVVPSGSLTPGQTFTLFSGAGAANPGNFAVIQSANPAVTFSFTNGVLTVLNATASNPTNLTFSVSGGTLSLSWPADHLGWVLQAQTNALSAGLTATNWVDVAGSGSVTATNFPVDVTQPTVFYRLRSPQ